MYLDLVLLLNMAVNYYLLQLTALIVRQKAHFYGILTASLVGALFPLLVYLMENPALLLWPIRILIPALMIFLSFRPQQLRQGFCQYLTFCLCAFALGGLALLFSSGEKLAYSGGEAYLLPPPSLLKLAFAAVVLFTGVRWLYPLVQEIFHFNMPQATLKMEVFFNGKSKQLKAFVDTGNMLRCPFTGTPVAVAAYGAVRDLLPFEMRTFLKRKGKIDWFQLEAMLSRSKDAAKFSLIPYHSLQETDYLLAFRPERLKLMEEGGAECMDTPLLIAVQQEGRDGADYDVLLPLETWRNTITANKERKTVLL